MHKLSKSHKAHKAQKIEQEKKESLFGEGDIMSLYKQLRQGNRSTYTSLNS